MSGPRDAKALATSQAHKAPLQFRPGIGAQIYMGLFGSVVLVLAASFVAYYFLNEIVQYQSRLAVQSIPNLSRSAEVARRSASLVNGAVRMVSATTLDEHASTSSDVRSGQQSLAALVEELATGSALRDRADVVETSLGTFGALLDEIHQSSRRRLEVDAALNALVDQLGELNKRIGRTISVAIDDQGFYLVEGLRHVEDRRVPLQQRASAMELAFYRDLIAVNHEVNLSGVLLGEALTLSDRDLLEPLQERFRSAARSLMRTLDRLQARIPNQALHQDGARLVDIGESHLGVFALRREYLDRLAQERRALGEGRQASADLLADMDKLLAEVNSEAVNVNAQSQSAAATGIVLLLVLNVLSITGALLIGWLFVGRYLVRRLVGLAGAMRDMAGGDLEAPVAVSGNDEVTDMARALEVFRRHALEVQRLNLVEKLAEELDAKNHALEDTLARLNKAQEQIVAEEKLASLGQLTAGVAHEIKNPLNFVNNFAEVSLELLDEVGEVLAEGRDGAIDADEIREILEDLKVNLGKIGEHGERANGIVRSMLDHSRGAPGDWRETDLNALLKQYLDLAYHAMRAQTTDFNATLLEDLDDAVGVLKVVPQDLSRAFLNILTNACQAIEERRGKENDPDYQPELRIASRRTDDGVTFAIRDNGAGIPQALRRKIFEPFVTTKDTGQGTGLGLSLTADIVTRHGGAIEVDSQEGVFTEFRIHLPPDPAAFREQPSPAEEL